MKCPQFLNCFFVKTEGYCPGTDDCEILGTKTQYTIDCHGNIWPCPYKEGCDDEDCSGRFYWCRRYESSAEAQEMPQKAFKS